MAVEIAANTAQFNKALSQATTSFNSFTSRIAKLGGTLGVAFGIREVLRFGLEISKLAGEAEGVRGAFVRLGNSAKILEDLKRATGGTVSELALMKAAVQANNFQIPIENLSKLFEFATLRAQQTGQSVDYLVESIILGIGRKSPLILDNLGISAVRLREKLKGVSTEVATVGDVAKVVGNIADEELKGMAGFSENASTKIQRLNSEWENFRIELGTTTNKTALLGTALDDLALILKNLSTFLNSDASAALRFYLDVITVVPRHTLKAANAVLEFANDLTSLETAVADFNDQFKGELFAGVITDTAKYNSLLADMEKKANAAGKKIVLLTDDLGRTVAVIKPFSNTVINIDASKAEKTILTLDKLNAIVKDLTEQFRATNIAEKEQLKTLAAKIISYRQQIEEIEKLLKLENYRLEGIEGLRHRVSELNDEYEKVNINDTKRLNAISQEINALDSLIKKLEDVRKKRNEDVLTKNSLPFFDTKKTKAGGREVIPQEEDLNAQVEKGLEKLQRSSVSTADVVTGQLFRISTEWINMGTVIQDIAGILETNLEELAIGIGEVLGSLLSGQGSFADFGKLLLGQIGKTLTQLGELLIATGIGIAAFKQSLRSLNPAIAIGAGIALVALGSVIAGSIKKLGSSGGSGAASTVSTGAGVRPSVQSNIQDNGLPRLETVIRGQDLFVVLSNYNNNNRSTRFGG